MEWRHQQGRWIDLIGGGELDKYRSSLLTTTEGAASKNGSHTVLPSVATVYMPGYDPAEGHGTSWSPPIPFREDVGHEDAGMIAEHDLELSGSIRQETAPLTQTPAMFPVRAKKSSQAHDIPVEFVSYQGPSGKRDATAESKIRSHAMRRVHRQRRANKDTPPAASNSVTRRSRGKKACRCSSSSSEDVRTENLSASGALIGETNLCNLPTSRSRVLAAHSLLSSGWASTRIPSIIPTGPVTCVQCGKVRLLSWPAEDKMVVAPYHASPVDMVSPADLDPFSSGIIPINHHMHELLNHFVNVIQPTSNPFIYGKANIHNPITLYIMPMVMGDRPSMHAILASAAIHQLSLKSKRSKLADYLQEGDIYRTEALEAYSHYWEAVRLMQKRMENPKDALSNTSIFIACSLTAIVGFTGEIEQLDAHYNGLVKMVRLRGGINTLPRNIAHHVSRIDTYSAWHNKSAPKIPMYTSRFRGGSPVSAASPTSAITALGPPFDNNRLETFLWKSLFSVACDLQSITFLLEMHARQPSKVTDSEREFFEDTYADAQHILVSLPHPENVMAKSLMYYRQNCWRAAALLYFNIALRTCPAVPLIKSMTDELMLSLQESDLASGWPPNSDILLWILLIGVFGSWDPLTRGWFIMETKRVVRTLGLKSEGEAEVLMKSLLWRDNKFKEPLKELWRDHLS